MQVASYLKLSVAVAAATIALKTGAWWVSGSVGLLSDALESLVNLAGAVFALAMVTWAASPPDDEHPYGHHKAEYFSSGFEGVLIFAAALAILWAAVQRLMAPQPLEQLGWGLALSLAATALNAALAGAGWQWLDPVIAIAVALNILREGASLVRRSADGLMDRALEPDTQAQIRRVLDEFTHQAVRFDHVVTRRAGQRRFVDLHMHMPSAWTLGRAAALRRDVEQALMSAVPGLRATIQLLPMDVEAQFDEARDPL